MCKGDESKGVVGFSVVYACAWGGGGCRVSAGGRRTADGGRRTAHAASHRIASPHKGTLPQYTCSSGGVQLGTATLPRHDDDGDHDDYELLLRRALLNRQSIFFVAKTFCDFCERCFFWIAQNMKSFQVFLAVFFFHCFLPAIYSGEIPTPQLLLSMSRLPHTKRNVLFTKTEIQIQKPSKTPCLLLLLRIVT